MIHPFLQNLIQNLAYQQYLTLKARKAFIQLKQAFIKAPILQPSDSKYHIQIQINALSFAIGKVLSELNFDWIAPNSSNLARSDFGQWHPVAYFSRKMIPAKT